MCHHLYLQSSWFQSCNKIMNYPDTISLALSPNLLHQVNRKENNLDYWYVCLVECRVNHDHLSIIRSEYIIMISCSFVDVHPAICIYQQSKLWAKTFFKIHNCWYQLWSAGSAELLNMPTPELCFNSWDVTQTQTNTSIYIAAAWVIIF